jgi:hypothetical protein
MDGSNVYVFQFVMYDVLSGQRLSFLLFVASVYDE